MLRTSVTITAFCTLLPMSFATTNPNAAGPIRPELGSVRLPLTLKPVDQATPTQPPELAVTDGTEVLVDGRDCELAKVPPTATVVRVEVGPDRRTILKIEFRTKK